MYRLIAVDMDGTLLRSDLTIHPDTVRDMREAVDRGMQIAFCSGRSIPELSIYFDQLPMVRYAVCCNGAFVCDCVNKECFSRQPIEKGIIDAAMKTARRLDAMPQLMTGWETVIGQRDFERLARFPSAYHYQPLFEATARRTADIALEAERLPGVVKMGLYFSDQASLFAAWDELRPLPATVVRQEDTSLEITAQHTSKASGLTALAKHLQIGMEEVAGIGDSGNDAAMLQAVGLPIAMGNAKESVKKQCRLITDDNDHNGVGKAILRLLRNS